MSRPILSRPRTRVYGCNYDKGESYYKPMVDHLDRKYSARPLFSEPRNSLADEIAARRSDIGTRDLSGPRNNRDLDLEFEPLQRSHRPAASSAIDPLFPEDEDMVYDSRGQRTRRRFANDFANEVAATTRRFKARLAALEGSEEPSDQISSEYGRRQQDSFDSSSITRKSIQSSSLKSSSIEESDTALKRRSKLFDESDENIGNLSANALTRWTKLVNDVDEEAQAISAAATRAKQTKARLSDIESEMEELAERQARRERRAAVLRNLVNENAASGIDDFTQQINKKVSARVEKHVTF